MKKLFIITAMILICSSAFAGTKLEIHSTTPYINGTIGDCNSTYCYGIVNGSLSINRWDSSFTKTARTYEFATQPPIEVFATSTDGLIFAVHKGADSKYSLWKSTNHGDTFAKVLDLGDHSGTQIANVWALQRGFAEVTIGGVTKYLIGEYNVNESRTAGGENDKVRIMQSTDGTTWTELVKFNNDGSNTNVRHIHFIKQDPYTGYIYFAFGDWQAQAGMIRWDSASGTWADNLNISDYEARTGFKSVTCGVANYQRYKPVDILFTQNYLHVMSDTSTAVEGMEGEVGIWRAAKDFTGYTRVNSDIASYTNHAGWAGVISASGLIVWTDSVNGGSTAEKQGNVWTSDDGGATYTKVAYLGFYGTEAGYAKVNKLGNNILFGLVAGAGKHYADTAVAVESGSYTEEFPVVLHPVFFVATTGTDDDAADRGFVKADPWATPQHATESNRMTYGSRIILSAGAYTTDYAFTFEFAGNALPGTGMFIMEGASKDTTSYKMGSGSTQEYVIYTGRVNDQAYLFKNMKIYAEQPTNDTALATIVYCGAAARTGVTCYFRDTILGDPAIDTNGFILNVYNAIDVKRSYMYGSAGNSVVRPEKDAASISIQYSVLNGGAMHLYLNGFAGLTTTLYNNVLYGYTLYGVRYDQDMPTLKNNIFYGGTGNLTSINDQGSATETDTQIDYNIFYSNGDVPWEVANAGGSHSVTKDPSFISAGSDFRRNPPLNDGVSVAGVHIAGCSDFSGQPCLKGAAPDIGAYEKSLGGLFQQFNKTNRYAPHRRLH